MTCSELKTKIVKKELKDAFFVFVYPDNKFLTNQYVEAISKTLNFKINYIDNLEDALLDNFDFCEDKLFVLITDKFDIPEPFTPDIYNNLVVICNKYTGTKDYVIEFPKLTQEYVLEYMKTVCPGVNVNNLSWLYDAAQGDIYKIDLELQKLKLYKRDIQNTAFEKLRDAGNYADLVPLTIYNLVNDVFYKNIDNIKTILNNLDVVDIEGTGLVTLLKNNIRDILLVQTSATKNPTAAMFGFTDKKLYVIKGKCNKFSTNSLVNTFEFLTSIDYKLKSGWLDLTNTQLVSYVLNNVIDILYTGGN